MVRILKWFFGILAALIIVVIVGGYLFLVSYDFNAFKPRIAEIVKDTTNRELSIEGDIDLDIGLTPSIILTDISFENAPWGSRPDMLTLKRLEVQVELIPLIKKDIRIKRFILYEPEILIEKDKSGQTNLTFNKTEKATGNKEDESTEDIELPAITFNKTEIVDGLLTYRDNESGKTTKICLTSLVANAESVESPVEISIKGSYEQNNININGLLGPLTSLTNPDKTWPIKLTAETLDTTVELDGSIKDAIKQSGIDIGFNILVRNWEEIGKFAGQPIPIEEGLKASGRLKDKGPKGFDISNLRVSTNDNVITGAAGINLADKIPKMNISLASNNLDLRPYIQKETEEKAPEKEGKKSVDKKDRVFPSDPLPSLDGLKSVEGTFNVRIDKLFMPKLVVNNLAIKANMLGGRLDINPLKAVIGGGELDGSLKLIPRGKEVDISTRLKIKGFELAKMLKELEATEAIEGNLDVDLDLQGRGSSVAGIMAGLNGHTSVIMNGGSIKNKNIDLLGGNLSSSLLRLLNPAKEIKDYTTINCMVSRFDVKKGLADSTALVVDTERMSIAGEGDIDLKTENLDISIKPIPKEGIGGFSLSLSELAKPFKLSGTLAQPSLAIDTAQATLALGKAVGGLTLFGPIGIAAALLGKSKGDSTENPCLAAIEAAKSGVKPTEKQEPATGKTDQESSQDSIKNVIPNIGKSLKSLFGK